MSLKYLVLILLALSACSSATQIEWSEEKVSPISGYSTAYSLDGETSNGIHFEGIRLAKNTFNKTWALSIRSEYKGHPKSKIHSKNGNTSGSINSIDFIEVINFIKSEAVKKEIIFLSISINVGLLEDFKDAYLDVLYKTRCDYSDRSKKLGECLEPEIKNELYKRNLIAGICSAISTSSDIKNCSWESEYPIFFGVNSKGMSSHDKNNVDWDATYFYISY